MRCYLVIEGKGYPLSFASAMRVLAFLKARTLEDAERVMIESTLTRVGRADKAASALGISRKSLWEKRKRYGISADMRRKPR